MASGSFKLSDHLPGQIGTAFYFSGGEVSSLTFGDVVATTGFYRALADLETMIGLATVSLAVAYVLAALDALASLNRLHGRVRLHRPGEHGARLSAARGRLAHAGGRQPPRVSRR
jgi:hypothetical protein